MTDSIFRPAWLCVYCLISGGVLVSQGCRPRSDVPIVDAGDSTPAEQPAFTSFEVSVAPQESDPRRVDVWVETSDPALWDSLPAGPDAADWPRIILVQPKDDFHPQLPGNPGAEAATSGLEGAYSIVEGRLRFRLAEPLAAGGAYRVEFRRSAIPGFKHPAGEHALPIVVWHVVPERTGAGAP